MGLASRFKATLPRKRGLSSVLGRRLHLLKGSLHALSACWLLKESSSLVWLQVWPCVTLRYWCKIQRTSCSQPWPETGQDREVSAPDTFDHYSWQHCSAQKCSRECRVYFFQVLLLSSFTIVPVCFAILLAFKQCSKSYAISITSYLSIWHFKKEKTQCSFSHLSSQSCLPNFSH